MNIHYITSMVWTNHEKNFYSILWLLLPYNYDFTFFQIFYCRFWKWGTPMKSFFYQDKENWYISHKLCFAESTKCSYQKLIHCICTSYSIKGYKDRSTEVDDVELSLRDHYTDLEREMLKSQHLVEIRGKVCKLFLLFFLSIWIDGKKFGNFWNGENSILYYLQEKCICT